MKLTSPKFDENEIEMIQKCLDSGWVTSGPYSSQFEELFSKRHHVKHALTTTSCTAALHLAVMAIYLGPLDEVIVPAFTWITSANCIEYAGAKVKFVDVDPVTYNLDLDAFESAITERTKAVIVVHLFGLSCEMDRLLKICSRNNIRIIEDAACAVGTTYDGKPVGGFGDIGCFSFHPRKVITTGEGGMVTTNKKKYAELVNSLRNHGATGIPKDVKPAAHVLATFENLGFNLRMSDIQAAVGVAQMAKLDGLLSERYHLAERYNNLLGNIDEVAIPTVPDKCGHTYQSYVIRILKGGIQKRNAIMDILAEKNIQTRPGTHAVHRLGYYKKKYGFSDMQFPNASLCEDTTITLPMFPGMTQDEQEYVVENIVFTLKRL